MEFKLEDIEETFNGEIVSKISNNEYLIKIQDKEHHIQILDINSRGMEFVLDNHYHNVNYLENQTGEMKIVLDGVPLTSTRIPNWMRLFTRILVGLMLVLRRKT